MSGQPSGPRFREGDQVVPSNPAEWYERDAGTVTTADRDGYLVRFPAGFVQTYTWRELRPAREPELVVYHRGVLATIPADSQRRPDWDANRGVFHLPLARLSTEIHWGIVLTEEERS